VRDSLAEWGLQDVPNPNACGELAELARCAVAAFEAIEALLDQAAERLIDAFAAAARASNEVDPNIIVERAVEIADLADVQAQPVEAALARLANESTRQARRTHATMLINLRLDAHRALHALERAIEASPLAPERQAESPEVVAPPDPDRAAADSMEVAATERVEVAQPTPERDAAESISRALRELADEVGLGSDQPLARLWPRLVTRVVEVERVRAYAPRAS
jgi:hypothetical protein